MRSDKYVRSLKLGDGSLIKLEHRKALTSTSALAKSYANAGYPNKYVIFTEKQYASPITKTRLGEGVPENGIFISCILRPSFFPSQAGLLAPLAAVALLTGLEEHTDKQLGLGWLSDVYCEGVRIGGVSVEGKLNSFSSYEYLIVSFAVHLDEKSFPPRITDMIRKVFESGNESVAMIIAKTILHKFFSIYSNLKAPEKYMDIYKRKFILYDKKIKYLIDGKKRTFRVVDVDRDTCALTVAEKHGQEMKISSPSGVIVPPKIRLPKN